MPDYAPNYTSRYRVRYQVIGRAHVMQFRGFRSLTQAAMVSAGIAGFTAIYSNLSVVLSTDFSVLDASYAPADSDVFVPASVPTGITGSSSVANMTGQDSISHMTFAGRGLGGSKFNVKAYGIQWAPDLLPANAASDFRILGTESPQVQAAYDDLADVSDLCAIDNTAMNWYTYVNLKVNDYWLRKLRQGA